MHNLLLAYRYQRLSLSLVWKGHARLPASPLRSRFGRARPKQAKAGTGFSAEIGRRGPRAPGAQWQLPLSSEISLGRSCLN